MDKYPCLYVDLPWHYKTSLPGFGLKEGAEWKRPGSVVPYATMSIDQMLMLPVSEIAAKQAHLYLWVPNFFVESAYQIARQWGFTPSILMPWIKTPRGSAGFPTYAIQTEYLLFCRRGGLRPLRRWPTNWFAFPRGKHSAKPPGMREIIEQVTPGPRCELFARGDVPGWATWGDQTDSDPGIEAIMRRVLASPKWLGLAPRIQPALRRAKYGGAAVPGVEVESVPEES